MARLKPNTAHSSHLLMTIPVVDQHASAFTRCFPQQSERSKSDRIGVAARAKSPTDTFPINECYWSAIDDYPPRSQQRRCSLEVLRSVESSADGKKRAELCEGNL